LCLKDYNREEVSDENAAQQLGIEMVYFLQTVLLVDKLQEYLKTHPGMLYTNLDTHIMLLLCNVSVISL